MKKYKKMFFLLLAFLLVFSGFLYSQSVTIWSNDQIMMFRDPTAPSPGTWSSNDIDGTLILSWDIGVSGSNAGFCDLTLYTPAPNGGKYEISLITVISSTRDEIQGVWKITKNSSIDNYLVGSALNLDTSDGGIISLEIGNYLAEIRVTRINVGIRDKDSIAGQIEINGYSLTGAYSILEKTDGTYEPTTTDGDGKYEYLVPKDDFKKVGIGFVNFFSELTVSGYIYAGGQPLINAKVMVRNFLGVLLDVVYTNELGQFETDTIEGATGGNNYANGLILSIVNPDLPGGVIVGTNQQEDSWEDGAWDPVMFLPAFF
jgi:hypothetical protein